MVASRFELRTSSSSRGSLTAIKLFALFLRWTKRDNLAAVARGTHAHGDSGRPVCIHACVVLVSAGSLPIAGLHTHKYHWA